MKAFIWDLDGTLLDSYGVITSSAVDTLKEHGIAADTDELLRYMKNRSLSSWLRKASAEYGIPFERLLGRYGEITHGRDDLITLAPGAAETLRGIREALSVRHLTNIPIKFIGVSEKMDGLTEFHPDRMANRIIGMGDVISLVEKVESEIDEEEAMKAAKKMTKGNFDLEDFLGQLNQIKKSS